MLAVTKGFEGDTAPLTLLAQCLELMKQSYHNMGLYGVSEELLPQAQVAVECLVGGLKDSKSIIDDFMAYVAPHQSWEVKVSHGDMRAPQ